MNDAIALKISISGFLVASFFTMALACCCIVLCMRRIANTRVATSRPFMSPCHIGLSPEALGKLPTFAHQPSVEKNLECVICLSELLDGENGRRLPPCGHSFHVDCVDVWFKTHSTCPTCRTAIDSGFSDITVV
jgi:Ring finger domain